MNSLQKDRLKTTTAWIIYLFINVLACIKYNPFEKFPFIFFIIVYPLFAWGIYTFTKHLKIQQKNFFFFGVVSFIILFTFFLFFYIDRYSVDVDRWSALAYWSENLKHGRYPYGTPTHTGHYASPYPVWQLFHFPFHLMGDTGYGQIFCLLVFFTFLYFNKTKVNAGGILLLLALSPVFWWEMSVRSDLLCNMLLVYIFLSSQFYYAAYWKKHKYLTALIVGLFLCTKMLVIIPLFLYFFPVFLKYNYKEKLLFALIVIAGFTLPFVPLLFGENSILNHPEYNPMLQQTRQGNIWVVIVGSVLIIWASVYWNKMRDCFFFAGLFLFALIFTVGIRIMFHHDFSYVLFEDELDKSYFNVSLPFLLFYLNEIRKETFPRYTFI
jgi:hypothetical protein